MTNCLFPDAQPSGSRQSQLQQQLENEEFEDFFSGHPKPRANNEHLKGDYCQHFIRIFGENPKPSSGDEQLKGVYHCHFDQSRKDVIQGHTSISLMKDVTLCLKP